MNKSIINSQGIAATSDLEETLKLADLNWEPLMEDIVGAKTGVVVPRKKILYRSDSMDSLGITGPDYVATSPRAFLEMQYKFAEHIKGTVVRTGFLPARSRTFAFIKMEKDLMLPKEVRAKGDPIACYIYSTDGWDGKTPRQSCLYMERLVCTNGMVSQEIKADLWVSHTKNSELRFGAQWTPFLLEVNACVKSLGETFVKLAQERMTEEQARLFLGDLMPGESTATENKRATLLNLFKQGAGNEGRTRYDALNAVTEYVTHQKTFHNTDKTPAEVNRFLGVMGADTLRDRAYNLLLN